MNPVTAIRTKGKVERVEDVLTHVEALAKRHETFLQVVDPAAVYNQRHLDSAFGHAERAQREGRATGKTLGAEFLMYLTGERQVSVALEKAGIRPGLESTILVAHGARAGTVLWGLLDKLGWSKDPAGVGTNPGALARINAKSGNGSDPEHAVLERVALLDVHK